jgi:hypothetical protein
VHACKRCWLWQHWLALRAEEQKIDYRGMREVADGTGRVDLDPACTGGACAW